MKVEKIKYVRKYFDLETYKANAKEIIEIFPDGHIIAKDYEPGSRKIRGINAVSFPADEFSILYTQLRDCIDNADTLFEYVDDADITVSIYHNFDRIETMPRGIGISKHNISVYSILSDFLSKH